LPSTTRITHHAKPLQIRDTWPRLTTRNFLTSQHP
jgi:hypothetical protein